MSEPKRALQLQRIYVKDISFESPGAPEIFTQEWQPKMNVQLNNGARRLGEGNEYEVEVTVTLTAELNGKTAYLAEAKQAGIFTIIGIEGDELENVLGAYCPNMLFPYARETLSSLVVKGSFPAFPLQPINFDALFAQAKAKKEQDAAAAH